MGQGIELGTQTETASLTTRKVIPGKGGFVQLQLDPVAWYSLQLGTGVDNPRGIDPGGRGLNQTVHVGNAFDPTSTSSLVPCTTTTTPTTWAPRPSECRLASAHRLYGDSFLSRRAKQATSNPDAPLLASRGRGIACCGLSYWN